MLDLKEHPVPATVKRGAHWFTLLAAPSLTLLSAGYGGVLTAGLVVILGLTAIASIWTVFCWTEMVHITAEDSLDYLMPTPIRVASGILVIAGCLLHDGWLGVALAAASMFELVVSEILYVEAEDTYVRTTL